MVLREGLGERLVIHRNVVRLVREHHNVLANWNSQYSELPLPGGVGQPVHGEPGGTHSMCEAR